MNHNVSQSELVSANRVYDCIRQSSFHRIWVSFPELKDLIQTFRDLNLQLDEDSKEDYWILFNWRVRRYQFLLSTLPLPPNYSLLDSAGSLTILKHRLTACSSSFPAHTTRVNKVVQSFEKLAKRDRSPFLDALISQGLENADSTIVVIRERQFIDGVQKVLSSEVSTSRMRAMSPHEVVRNDCAQHLVVLGARRWYPEHLFTAPRAEHIHLFCYDWIRDNWNPEGVFVGSKIKSRKSDAFENVDAIQPAELISGSINPEDLIAEIDLSRFALRFSQSREENTESEEAEAILLSLEGGAGVFIDAADEGKIRTIDFEADGWLDITGRRRSRLKKIPVSHIEPGIFVLLRTGGGGDYLVPVADRFLGDHSQKARGCQANWKTLLRERVRAKGPLETSIELLDLGSIRADENNVRTWTSSRNIGPQDIHDFEAIMRLVGLEANTAEYWTNTEAIRSAHMKAGFYISRLLFKIVDGADLSTLERTGRMEFELTGTDAGSLVALRVLAVSRQTFSVAASRIGEPFEIEEAENVSAYGFESE